MTLTAGYLLRGKPQPVGLIEVPTVAGVSDMVFIMMRTMLTSLVKRLAAVTAIALISASSLARAPHADQSRFADFDGVKVHYEDIGSGELALIFVHGWTCNAEFWRRSTKEFPDYRVIALDLPGHGQSDKPPGEKYTMQYFAKSIASVMRQAGVSKAVLVGHSMGVQVVREFYLMYPSRTLALVAVDGTLRRVPSAQMDEIIGRFHADYGQTASALVDDMIKPIRDQQLREEIRVSMLATPDYVGLGAAEGIRNDADLPQGSIHVPVLAVLAAANWPPDVESQFKFVAPSVDVQIWNGVSHFLMMEQPDRFNRSVRSFVARNRLLPQQE